MTNGMITLNGGSPLGCPALENGITMIMHFLIDFGIVLRDQRAESLFQTASMCLYVRG